MSKVFASARETLSQALELVLLEGRRAALSLLWMIVGGLIATILFITAWTGLMAALAMTIVSFGMSPVVAVIVVAAVHLVAGAGLIYWCVVLSRNLLFTASRRQLASDPVVESPAP